MDGLTLAEVTDGAASLANSGMVFNCKLVTHCDGSAWLRATRDVRAHEELLRNFGRTSVLPLALHQL